MLGKSFSCWTTQEIRWRSIKIQHCDNVLLKMLPNIKASVKQWPWTKSLQVHCLAHLLKLPVGSHWPHTRGGHTRKQIPITQWWHRADTPKMSTSRAGTTRTPSQRRCWLIPPGLCDSGDAHTSPSSEGTSCLVGANEVAPSPWPGPDLGISV